MKRKNLFRWSVVLMVLIALMMGAGTAFAQDGGADPAVVDDAGDGGAGEVDHAEGH